LNSCPQSFAHAAPVLDLKDSRDTKDSKDCKDASFLSLNVLAILAVLSSVPRPGRRNLAVHLDATLPDPSDLAGGLDIGGGISPDQDEVGAQARGNPAAVGQTEGVGRG
jgi:hypothetical protein